MNWPLAITIFCGLGFIIWIIIAAKVEGDKMNENKWRK